MSYEFQYGLVYQLLNYLPKSLIPGQGHYFVYLSRKETGKPAQEYISIEIARCGKGVFCRMDALCVGNFVNLTR